MSGASPEERVPDNGRRRLPRRQRRLLIATGVATAVAVTWGGLAAVGTLAPAEAETLSATAPGSSGEPAPSASPRATSASDGTTSSDGKQSMRGDRAPGAEGKGSPAPTPDTAATPDTAPTSGKVPASGSVGAPAAGAGRHAGHLPGTGGKPGGGALPTGDAPGAPLVGEEPTPPGADSDVAPPGSQEELSLDEAAAQPATAESVAAAPPAVGGGSRTEGLTPRAPIDPAEVTGGGASTLGGCLPEYGTNGQCLPTVPPSMAEHAQQMAESGISLDTMQHPWSCAEVRQLFPEGLAVRQAGVDPQKLDTSGDGTACGTDD